MDSICLAVGALILGIIAYLLWKRPLRGAHVQRDPTLVQPVGSYDPGSDSFLLHLLRGRHDAQREHSR